VTGPHGLMRFLGTDEFDNHLNTGLQIHCACVHTQVVIACIHPVAAGHVPNEFFSSLIGLPDQGPGLVEIADILDLHHAIHPELLRGMDKDVENPCPASQDIKCAPTDDDGVILIRDFPHNPALQVKEIPFIDR
jgi:hypothetical protein